MRTKLLLGALLTLVPVPALADVTAHYTVDGKPLLVEADDHGNSRIGMDGKFAIIHREGTDYVAVVEKSGTKVFELKAMADMIKSFIPKTDDPQAKEFQFGITPGAAAAVAGQPGATWNLVLVKGDAQSMKKRIELVASADPRLAPVGAAFRGLSDIAADLLGAMFPEETGFRARLIELFAKGAPLRITPVEEGAAKPEDPLIELQSLDTAKIDASHFELPAPVTPADEILGAMDSLMDSHGGKVQPLP